MPSHPERVRAAGLPSGYQFPTLAEAVAADRRVYSSSEMALNLRATEEQLRANVGEAICERLAHNGYDDDWPERDRLPVVEGCEVKGYGHGV